MKHEAPFGTVIDFLLTKIPSTITLAACSGVVTADLLKRLIYLN